MMLSGDAALAGAIFVIAMILISLQSKRLQNAQRTTFLFLCAALLMLAAAFAVVDKPAAKPMAIILLIASIGVFGVLQLQAARQTPSDPSDSHGLARQNAAFGAGAQAAGLTVFVQDHALRYQWISQPHFDYASEEDMIGLRDADLMPEAEAERLTRIKREIFETGTPASFEIEVTEGDERKWYQVDIAPFGESDGEPKEIVGIANDISRLKRLDKLRQGLARRLAENTQRFQLALKSGKIHVFSQDRDFVYDWTSSEITPFGRILGQCDADIFSGDQLNAILNAKEACLEGMESRTLEIRFESAGAAYWYDLAIEPNIAPDGTAIGLISSAIDVTERKLAEDRQTLLLRELTHRSKNLLTVIQAIAGQTARAADDTKAFVAAFNQRLRGLGATQDLLVAENWASVDLERLCVQQTEPLVKNAATRIEAAGPHVALSPEAAQALGLALHELATNALKYGALSNDAGSVSITWVIANDRFRLKWAEEGGPPVTPPEKRGFGRVVIEDNLAASLGASVEVAFGESGVVATVDAPAARLASTPRSHGTAT